MSDSVLTVSPLKPERFVNLGIEPPKGVLLFGPPGTGKTLCARAVANRTDACFIRVIGSELVQKYVGEVSGGAAGGGSGRSWRLQTVITLNADSDCVCGSQGARMVRELFEMARTKKACLIFFDEIDAIGGQSHVWCHMTSHMTSHTCWLTTC